jgi:hypothetical protein
LALTDSKYGRLVTPSAAADYLIDGTYYATASWYQPKFAANYSLIRRYGNGDRIGGFCLQGATATTYFRSMNEGLALLGAE